MLLHGWGFSSALFASSLGGTKKQYRTTVIDLPGHGKSANVEGGFEQWCNAIIKVLPKNPILLGWSLGGLLAIGIARKVALKKLVLLASTPNFIANDNWNYGIPASHFRQFSNALALNPSKSLKRFVSLQTNDKTQLKTLNQLIDKNPATTKSLHQGLDILLTTDLVDEFSQLNLPITAILGEYDTLVPKRIISWYDMQGVKTYLLNTGHSPFLDSDFKFEK